MSEVDGKHHLQYFHELGHVHTSIGPEAQNMVLECRPIQT